SCSSARGASAPAVAPARVVQRLPGTRSSRRVLDGAGDRVDDELRLVAVRRMPAIRESQEMKARGIHGVALDRRDLLRRAVLVVLAEDRDHRSADAPQLAPAHSRTQTQM